jgi:hypothetical protein
MFAMIFCYDPKLPSFVWQFTLLGYFGLMPASIAVWHPNGVILAA